MSIKSFISTLFRKLVERMKWGKGVFKHVSGKIEMPEMSGDKDAWREFNTKITDIPGEPAVNPHDQKDQPKESPCGGESINGPISKHEFEGVTVIQSEVVYPSKDGPAELPGSITERDEDGKEEGNVTDVSAKGKK